MSTANPEIPANPQQIQQAIDSIVTPQKPIEIDLGTGEIFRGQTHEELVTKLAAAKAEATRHIQSTKAELADVRSKLATLEAQIPKPQQGAGDEDTKKYYETWATDPTEATRQQLGKLFGLPADKVVEVLKSGAENSVVNKAADEFVMRCPDYPQSQEAAALMREGMKARFGDGPQAMTADNLELVYHDLVRNGKLAPAQMQTSATVNGPGVMPNLRGGSAPPNPGLDLELQLRSMPLDQLKATLERLSLQTQPR